MEQRFTAQVIKHGEVTGAWHFIAIPFDVKKVWNRKGYVKVKGSLNGYEFHGLKLMPMVEGQHFMALREKIRKMADLRDGDTVEVHIAPDNSELEIPDELMEAVRSSEKALSFFNSLTESQKNYYVQFYSAAKQQATRESRLVKAVFALEKGAKYI